MSLVPRINFPINFYFWEGPSHPPKRQKGGGTGGREREGGPETGVPWVTPTFPGPTLCLGAASHLNHPTYSCRSCSEPLSGFPLLKVKSKSMGRALPALCFPQPTPWAEHTHPSHDPDPVAGRPSSVSPATGSPSPLFPARAVSSPEHPPLASPRGARHLLCLKALPRFQADFSARLTAPPP